jgi:hypothetical protein
MQLITKVTLPDAASSVFIVEDFKIAVNRVEQHNIGTPGFEFYGNLWTWNMSVKCTNDENNFIEGYMIYQGKTDCLPCSFKARTGDELLVKISQFVFKECALRNEE